MNAIAKNVTDSSGNEHGSDGKFVARGVQRTYNSNGDGGFLDRKVKAEYTFKPREGGGLTVHGPSGKEIGHVTVRDKLDRKFHEGTYTGGKSPKVISSSYEREESPESHERHAKAVAIAHFKDLTRTVKPKMKKGAAMTTTIGDLLGAPQTAGDVLKKYYDVSDAGHSSRVAGSMEHFIDLVRAPLTAGSGCEYGPSLDETGALKYDYDSNRPNHYPSVVATFADRGIVHCPDCKKFWEVPFEIKEDNDQSSVVTGEPVERLQAYITPDAAAKDDEDGDEAEEVNT